MTKSVSYQEEVGEVENVLYETKHVEWRIPDIFRRAEDNIFYISPTFSTADASWNLWVWGKSDSDYIQISIRNPVLREYAVGYCLGLKGTDDSVYDLVSGFMGGSLRCTDWAPLIEKKELLRRQTELTSSNILTVTCTLKWKSEISHSTEPTRLDKTKPMKLTSKFKMNILCLDVA